MPEWFADRLRCRLPLWFNRLLYGTARQRESFRWRTDLIREINLPTDAKLNLDSPEALRLFDKPLIRVGGWEFRCPELVTKHNRFLRHFFQLRTGITRIVHSQMTNIRRKSDLVVGIHIRRGDYQNWSNGRYYFSWETYAAHIKHVRRSFADQKVHFVLCSNEPIRLPIQNDMSIAGETAATDLFALSSCDLILGPPSSFSTWAGFSGNVPVWHIQTPDHFLDRSTCHIPAGLQWPSPQLRRVGETTRSASQ